jgi:hypothetical protein
MGFKASKGNSMKNNNNTRIMLTAAVVALGVAMWMPQLSLRRVSAQTAPNLTGAYGYLVNQPISTSNASPNAAVGVMTFDGGGKVSVNQTFVETDTAAGATAVKVQTATITGSYTVNADSTGTISLDLGGEKPATFAMVLTDSGSNIMVVSTGGSNIVTFGTMRKQ